MMVELQRISSHWSGWERMRSIWARCPSSSIASASAKKYLKIFEFVAGQRMMTTTSASVGWPWIFRRLRQRVENS